MLRLKATALAIMRSIPLLFRAAPATPLRVLCILALDTVHVLRFSTPLPRHRREQLSVVLDFQASTNAAWDGKRRSAREYEDWREQLDAAGLARWIDAYLERLRPLELERPDVGAGGRRLDVVREYREAVVRLSLATVAGIALHQRHMDDAVASIDADENMSALFRMAMQCQVIDDALDYREDLASGLPGFLTAGPLPQALSTTARAMRSYGTGCRGILPLRLALYVLTAMAALSVHAARWIYDEPRWEYTSQINN